MQPFSAAAVRDREEAKASVKVSEVAASHVKEATTESAAAQKPKPAKPKRGPRYVEYFHTYIKIKFDEVPTKPVKPTRQKKDK